MATYTVSYTTVELILKTLPDIGSASTITSESILHFAGEAEAYINARIAPIYSLPIKSDVPLLAQVATDLAIYRMLSRKMLKMPRNADEAWLDRYKEAMRTLDEIADGRLILVDSSGSTVTQRTDAREIDSTTRQYLPTMHEAGWLDMVQDEDKVDDLLDERDLQ